jgi:hypothetical protein
MSQIEFICASFLAIYNVKVLKTVHVLPYFNDGFGAVRVESRHFAYEPMDSMTSLPTSVRLSHLLSHENP